MNSKLTFAIMEFFAWFPMRFQYIGFGQRVRAPGQLKTDRVRIDGVED